MKQHYYISLLTTVLQSRTKKNQHYSLRAFAGDLKLDPTLLSKILNGKIVPSTKMMKKIADQLCLSNNDRKEFFDSYMRLRIKSLEEKLWGTHPEKTEEIQLSAVKHLI